MLHRIPSLVYRAMTENKRSFIIGEDRGDIVEGIDPIRRVGHSAYVSIMYGCNNFCTYCIVPYVRGRERSRRSADIIGECKSLIKSGVKEITLLGQNVNSYASDIDFPELLLRLANIEGDFLIRFMTSHPKDVSPRLMEIMGKYTPKVAPYFHLPLQSGSDKVLKDMHRTYNSEKFISTVDGLRAAVPDIALSTDVIVGFPTETDLDFEKTLDVLRICRFDLAYSFIYSPREGTLAAKMESISTKTQRSERMDELLKLQGQISYEKNQPLVGRELRVLVDSKAKRSCGYTYSARTDTNKLVHFDSDRDMIGSFIKVKITKANAFDLMAEVVK
jgi:tRNA-2-methylthio-N6-dimethylallyladenosine synthase